MTLFEKVIEVVLRGEGGFQKDPDDYGNWTGPNCTGELFGTKYGIAARYFYQIVKDRFGVEIKDLTIPQAKEIYFDYFWKPMNLEGIRDEELVLHIFDHGINSNKRLAIRMIQRIAGVRADGVIGPITEIAINNFKSISKVIEGYGLLYALLDYYKYARYCHYTDQIRKYPRKKKFYKGWILRIERTHF